MKLKLIKASEGTKDQICSMLEEWYRTGEKRDSCMSMYITVRSLGTIHWQD